MRTSGIGLAVAALVLGAVGAAAFWALPGSRARAAQQADAGPRQVAIRAAHGVSAGPRQVALRPAPIRTELMPGSVAGGGRLGATPGLWPVFEPYPGGPEGPGFLARGNGYVALLMPSKAVLLTSAPATTPGPCLPVSRGSIRCDAPLERPPEPVPGGLASTACEAGNGSPAASVVRFIGGDPAAPGQGEDPRAGRSHYLRGPDPRDWRADVPHYGGVRFRSVYPGIDVVYRGQDGQLVYELEVSPGADPDVIRLALEGSCDSQSGKDGPLVVQTRSGKLAGLEPVSLAAAAGLAYSGFLPGGEYDAASTVAVDGAGNAYVAGFTLSPDFVTTPGAFRTTPLAPTFDAFVTKVNAAGTSIVYSTYIGGALGDFASGIAVDGAGRVYVAGRTYSIDTFPTTPGAFQSENADTTGTSADVFVVKLNAAGSNLVYATLMGGRDEDHANRLAVDASGQAYVTGSTYSPDLPTTSGAFQPAKASTSNASTDAFVTKFNAAGSALVYSTFLGGSNPDAGVAIAVDGSGIAYVTGSTSSPNFPTTAGAFQRVRAGLSDAFVTKLGVAGGRLTYSTYLGGSSFDAGRAIAVNAAGQAHVAGFTGSTNFPTTAGALQPGIAGGSDLFVAKLSASGGGLAYSTLFGGSGSEIGDGLALDGAGNAHVVGVTESDDLPTTAGAPQPDAGGMNDAFLVKIAGGTTLVYSTYLGGPGDDAAVAVALDGANDAYVVGSAESGFPTTPTSFRPGSGRDTDGFLAKLDLP